MKKTLLSLVFILTICSQLNAQYLLDENFSNATFPPTGWTRGPGIASDAGVPIWTRSAESGYGSGSGSAFCYFYAWPSPPDVDSLMTPNFTATTAGDTLYFDHAYRTYITEVDSLVIYISTNGGATYTLFQQLPGGPTVGTGMVTAPPATGNYQVPLVSHWASKKYALPPGTNRIKFHVATSYGNNLFLDNIRIGKPPAADIDVTSIGFIGTQYFRTASYTTPVGTVENVGSSVANFTVTRKISPGGYSSTLTINNLAAGNDTTVTFAAWNGFTLGATYTVKDSVYLAGDINPVNDTLSGSITPTQSKTTLISYGNLALRDSIVADMLAAGHTGKFDTLSIGASLNNWSLLPWFTVFTAIPSASLWPSTYTQALKYFLDNSPTLEGLNKRTLIVFANDIGYGFDPNGGGYNGVPEDSVFYRQYLRAKYFSDDWTSTFGTDRFKGLGAFSSITNDSTNDPYPDCIYPVNGGSLALIPQNLNSPNDTVGTAIIFSNSAYNMFYCSITYDRLHTITTGDAPLNFFNTLDAWVDANSGQLPVELSSFTANVNQRDVNLNWVTVEELNNSGFDVERKAIDGQWTKVGFVNGSGTTNESKTYSFTDRGLGTGKYNYRLKQIDYNGNFEYFNLSSEINVGVPDKFDLSQNYPNPFNPVTKINYDLPLDGKIMLKVYDITGREIAQLVNEVQVAGYYTVTFNASNFASGVYFYKIFANGNNGQQYQMTKKMVLVK